MLPWFMNREQESELIARCRRGESDAWDILFQEHYPAVGRFLFQLSPNFSREDTEEIAQEVFLSVIRSIDSFQGNSQLQTWIFRIAANKARDFIERTNTLKRGRGQAVASLQEEDPETGLALDPPSAAPGPDAELASAEQAAFVRGALDDLGDPCREILELRYFGDLSYDEIGNALNLNPKTVSSRLSKCLDRLESVIQSALKRTGQSKKHSFPVK